MWFVILSVVCVFVVLSVVCVFVYSVRILIYTSLMEPAFQLAILSLAADDACTQTLALRALKALYNSVCLCFFVTGSEVVERVFEVIKERLPLAAQQPVTER